jgi:presenilin-like A22 family membrane protease
VWEIGVFSIKWCGGFILFYVALCALRISRGIYKYVLVRVLVYVFLFLYCVVLMCGIFVDSFLCVLHFVLTVCGVFIPCECIGVGPHRHCITVSL